MKEMEIDTLVAPWVNARVAHLLSVCRMTAAEIGDAIEEESSSDDYNQVMFTQNIETIEAFTSHVVPVKAAKAYTRGCIDVMTQALWTEDGSLPQGLTVQNTYTGLRQGSKKAVVVVGNSNLTPRPSKRNPGGWDSCGTPGTQTVHGGQVTGGGRQASGSSYPQID